MTDSERLQQTLSNLEYLEGIYEAIIQCIKFNDLIVTDKIEDNLVWIRSEKADVIKMLEEIE